MVDTGGVGDFTKFAKLDQKVRSELEGCLDWRYWVKSSERGDNAGNPYNGAKLSNGAWAPLIISKETFHAVKEPSTSGEMKTFVNEDVGRVVAAVIKELI